MKALFDKCYPATVIVRSASDVAIQKTETFWIATLLALLAMTAAG